MSVRAIAAWSRASLRFLVKNFITEKFPRQENNLRMACQPAFACEQRLVEDISSN